jgi:imidazolonepropionase-like amidohydrolase
MYAIRAGTAFDGERYLPGGALVVLDGARIVAVQPAGTRPPESCEVLDAPDGTVLPGLIDTHVHLCADGTDGTLDRMGGPSDDRLHEVIGESLRRHLAAGVTTVRDLGDRRLGPVQRTRRGLDHAGGDRR